jgi:hypothetical protein
MRKQRNKSRFFLGLALNSIGTLFVMVCLMFLFAKTFGEVAIPAIHMMTFMMCIPVGTLLIGILGWFLAERSEW